MADDVIFHRPQYAKDLARQLLEPGPLDQALRSGVFLSGIRRIGKTTFLRQDLIPALLERRALALYVDLWTDRAVPPTALIRESVRAAVMSLATPGSALLARLRHPRGINVGALGFSFGLQLDALGQPGGPTLADVLEELVRKAEVDVVLIIDEIQQAAATRDGEEMLFALKAARDRINTATDLPGHLLIVGTGSHKSLVTDMATRRSQAFAGAHTASFEPLGKDYVEWFLDRVEAAGLRAPPLDSAFDGFRRMGHRPEELAKAVRQFQEEVGAGRAVDPSASFATVCSTLAAAAADIEIQAVESAGDLAALAFSRIATGQNKGLFAVDTLSSISRELGRDVSANDMNSAIDRLVAANLIVRKGHGHFEIADPFVKEVWLRQAQLRRTLVPSPGISGERGAA